MTELDIIVDNENNGNFDPEENFHQLVTVDNQDIFDVEEEIEQQFSAGHFRKFGILVMVLLLWKKINNKSEPWRELNRFGQVRTS